jgi:hypothetical protein
MQLFWDRKVMLFKLEKSKPFILRTTPKKTPENAPTQKYETPDIHPLPDAQSRNDADRWAINPCFTSSPDNHH